MQPMLNIALRAARSAGEMIFRSIERLDVISVDEKDAKDYVTEVDKAAELMIVQAIRKAYPTHSFLGEEGGVLEGSGEGADYQWIIDPLDGTTNFVRGVPHFAISIACKHRGRLEHAIVLDPVRQEEFTASRGRGAALNGRRLRVSNRKSLDGALLGTGFPFRDGQLDHLDNYLNMFRSLTGQTAGIRRAGAASLDLAYVAPAASTHSGSSACPSGTWQQVHCSSRKQADWSAISAAATNSSRRARSSPATPSASRPC